MPPTDPTRREIASLHLWGLRKGHDDIQGRIVVLQETTGVQFHEVRLRYNGSPFHERTFDSHEDAGKYAAEFFDDYLSRGWVVVPEDGAVGGTRVNVETPQRLAMFATDQGSDYRLCGQFLWELGTTFVHGSNVPQPCAGAAFQSCTG